MIDDDKQWELVGAMFIVGVIVCGLLASAAVLFLIFIIYRGIGTLL